MRSPSIKAMPYAAPAALPPAIRADLPPSALQTYFDAFNSAWERYADFVDRQAFCHRLARSAVRRHSARLVASSPTGDDIDSGTIVDAPLAPPLSTADRRETKASA